MERPGQRVLLICSFCEEISCGTGLNLSLVFFFFWGGEGGYMYLLSSSHIYIKKQAMHEGEDLAHMVETLQRYY